MRVVHFSLQRNHLHLIVEAKDKETLARGMQGLGSILARRINRLQGQSGALWDERYHARALKTPREVRNALAYVLGNWQKHGERSDGYSSSPWFDGWRGRRPAPNPPAHASGTWLLTAGWRRHGLLGSDEAG
jgi:hypothetical protein